MSEVFVFREIKIGIVDCFGKEDEEYYEDKCQLFKGSCGIWLYEKSLIGSGFRIERTLLQNGFAAYGYE